MKINNFAKRITAILCAENVKHIILSTIISFATIISNADTITINGYTWSYDVSNDAATITGVSPAEGDITIPSVIGGYRVTSIMDWALWGCSGLKSVMIPDSVTSIGDYAFHSCSALTSVTIGSGVASIGTCAFAYCSKLVEILVGANNLNYSSINGMLLSKDGKTLIQGVNGDVTIPDSVTSIGDWAFCGCRSLTSVTIPDSVTSIGGSAFAYCSKLIAIRVDDKNSNYSSVNGLLLSKDAKTLIQGVNGDVTIPDTVTRIGNNAFAGCSGLRSVEIPDSVTSIGDYAFLHCSALTSVTIPDSVTSIGYDAFRGCSALTSVTIPDSVTSIGYEAFYDCRSLTSVTIGSGVTSIGHGVFSGCSALIYDTTTIPGVKLVDGWVIDADESLSGDIDLINIRGIGYEAFCNCGRLTSVTIPDSVTSIGESAFYYCSGLTSVTIGSGVTSIGNYAFSDCSGLTSVTIPDSVTSIGDGAFTDCSRLTSVSIPDSVTSIGNSAFARCSGLTSVTIPDSVTSIGYEAFYNCGSLTSVTIPDSVTSIGNYAFYWCRSLTSVTIPDSVTSIGDWAFASCSSLTSVTIPNSMTSIGDKAFYGCSGLEKTYIPSRLKDSISTSVFDGCSSSLEKVYYNPISEIVVDADEAAVEEAVASVGFVDAAVKQMIGGSAEKYNAFKSWAKGIVGGEAMAITSPYAAVSYLLGSTAVFKAEPKVEIESVAMKEPANSTQGQTINVEVIVKDGDNAVKVATEKVAAMFEATSDIGDWNGEAKLSPIVSVLGTDQNGKMSFAVKPGEGKATRAFLRIKQ